MSLKIIRYRNYGKRMWSDPEFVSTLTGKRNKCTNDFYWSFFELNNGKVISLNFVENLRNSKLTSTDVFCNYTEHYKFEEDFTPWWNRDIAGVDDNLGYPTKEEEDLVEKFFRKHIEKTREIATEIVYV
jgi:hypothetical protein